MRDKYIEELINEVMGPRNGPEEIIVGADPYTEYVTGVIIPKKCKKGEKNPDSEILVPESDDSEEDKSDAETSPELPNELDPRMKPKSFGISFLIKGDNPVLKVCMTWGRYIRDMLYKIFDNQYYERQQHQLSGLPPALKGARKSECAPTRRNSPSGGVT